MGALDAFAAIVRKEERLTRLNRWLYHGLHSLDFPFLYYRRPLWDVVVIVLSVGGIVLSVTTALVTPPLWKVSRYGSDALRTWNDSFSAAGAPAARV